MEHDNLIHGLVRKRAEIAGLLEVALGTVQGLQNDLAHVDHVIHLFRPGLSLKGVKVKPKGVHPAKSGEMIWAIHDMLKTANGPLGTRAIAERLIAQRGLPGDDPTFVTTMARRSATALMKLRAKGLARCEKGDGLELRWVGAGAGG